MKAQISLTVSEGKRLIAKGLKEKIKIKNALKHGKIILKGGTTVSAISEEFVNMPLGISGRISPRGTKGPKARMDSPHCILIDRGKVLAIDDEELFTKTALSLSKGDLLITGANIFDSDGNAAMMAGAALGNYVGKVLPALSSEGTDIIIAVGLEKLSPIPIKQSIMAAGRKDMELSFGLAVGLIQLYGEIIHEQRAIELLADVNATVIGKGGIMGGEGSTTMVIEGESEEVYRMVNIVKDLKGAEVSGSPKSLLECSLGCIHCKEHLGCMYKKGLI